MGAYVVRISSLNDKHICQLFKIAASFSSLVLLSSSVSTANLSCLPVTTFSSLRFPFNSLLSHRFNFLRVAYISFFHLVVNGFSVIREYGSTLYVELARAVSPTNTNFWLTFLLTRLHEDLYEDLAVYSIKFEVYHHFSGL